MGGFHQPESAVPAPQLRSIILPLPNDGICDRGLSVRTGPLRSTRPPAGSSPPVLWVRMQKQWWSGTEGRHPQRRSFNPGFCGIAPPIALQHLLDPPFFTHLGQAILRAHEHRRQILDEQ